MKTRNGFEYMIENGKYTIDGYDFFDTLAELEADIDWQQLWITGKALKDENGWHLVEGYKPNIIVEAKPVKARGHIIAKCSHTGKFEASFESMEALRKAWPGAEIVCIEENNGYTVVYC